MSEQQGKGGSPLRLALARLWRSRFARPEGAESESEAARVQAALLRGVRAGRLQRERVPLQASVERAIVAGAGLEATKCRNAAELWISRAQEAPVLALVGGPGCGKTVAAAWALAEVGGRWRSASQVAKIFAAKYGSALDEQDLLLSAGLLVIDDVGGESDPALMASALYEIIDRRQYGSSRYRTILTANLDLAHLCKRYPNPRLVSRLSDRGIVTWVADASPDRRTHGRKRETE